MNRGYDIRNQVTKLLLMGVGLLGFVLYTPDAGHRVGAFFKIATSSSWQRPLDGAAAWCSFKIILLSLALALIIESIGTILARLKHVQMALLIFALQVFSALGFLVGGFFLFKALL